MAPLQAILNSSDDQVQTDADHGDSDAAIVKNGKAGKSGPEPTLFHKIKNQKSILALAVSDSRLYAGTQGGELLVRQARPSRRQSGFPQPLII